MKAGPRGLEAIFVGFYEAHGVIDNSAMLIPLEALLTGTGSVKPFRTRDYKIVTASRQFPLARLREWNLLLRSSKLVAEVSQQQFEEEVEALTDMNKPYVPKVIFERPIGIQHKMGLPPKGLWVADAVEDLSSPAAVESTASDSEVKVVGSYTSGGSSGSGRQQANSGDKILAEASFDTLVDPVAALSASGEHSLDLFKLNYSNFVQELESCDNLSIPELEKLLANARVVSKYYGSTGGGFNLDGEPVKSRKTTNPDPRPSPVEPEISSSFSIGQREEQI